MDIDIDVDCPIITDNGGYISLRQMILAIRSQNEGKTKGMRLFHGIDWCRDTKELWVNGRKGSGGSAYIFTFYEIMEGEARRMIKGLGTYLKTIYGTTCITAITTEDNWEASEAWIWDQRKHQFITPEARQLKSNVNYDENLSLMHLLEKEEIEEKNYKKR